MSIYLNNAATSWPKPKEVADAMAAFLSHGGANLARGTSSERDMETLNVVLDCRMKVASLLGGYEGADPRYVTFCSNITEALNVVLWGFVRPGMRVLTSSMEHNAVMRPLRALEAGGVEVELIPSGPDGIMDLEALDDALSSGHWDLAVFSHASNVCGTIQPIEDAAEMCRQTYVPVVLDTAQTAGILDIDAGCIGLAALCFTGHKGLMGPQGIGGIVWQPEFAERVAPFVMGGTGSFSHLETQPEDLPDRFESGTPNLPGIVGLHAALSWLEATGIDEIDTKEQELGAYLLEKLKGMDVALSGRQDMDERLSVFAFNVRGLDNGVLADELSRSGFETRPGLHCAPSAHRTLGTFPEGSLRVSLGWYNERSDVDAFIDALGGAVARLRG
ncbi:MAG: aminotransferase class V-fold PLP-dependent enzyme [Synergistaceae bacterium]|nr:aminotransferase class V-fold PLP-dependent enzyme [Synergistaceae bacterium]